MPDDNLLKFIYKCEDDLDLNTWRSNIQNIARYLGLNSLPDDVETYNLSYTYNTWKETYTMVIAGKDQTENI